MKIQLISLSLLNFKGIKNFTADFEHVTNIYGNNATGKTTIFDAFTWLLFGKDSTDRKDFEVKTLDENNKVIPKIEHEVSAVLDIDGQRVTLKSVLREKWVKKRGSLEAEFTGNETLYFWNEVPMQKQEYAAKINYILNEGLFKLLTNTLYFNQMKWQDRREVLMGLAGDISNNEVFNAIIGTNGKQDFQNLINILNGGKSLSEYKREISAQKKLIKDNLDSIPTRIDEASRSMPELLDFPLLEAKKGKLQNGLIEIDDEMMNASKVATAHYDAIRAKEADKNNLKTKLQDRQYQIKGQFDNARRERESQINDLQSQISTKDSLRHRHIQTVSINKTNIDQFDKKLSELRDKWKAIDAETLTFKEDQFSCPACKRALDESNIESQKEELTANFNKSKAERLDWVVRGADSVKAEKQAALSSSTEANLAIESLNTELTTLRAQLAELETQHANISANEQSELQQALNSDLEAIALAKDIAAIQDEINKAASAPVDNSALQTKKQAIGVAIEDLNKQLATKDQIEKTKARIVQLQDEEKKLAQQLADLEKTEFTIDQFNRAKMDTLEARINGRFQMVRFKLFATQINGGEIECCETLINGVPFSDANNAAKINAGLDIIKALSQHYKTEAPVFVDNAESVVDLLAVDNQVIRLVVHAGAMLSLGIPKYNPEYLSAMGKTQDEMDLLHYAKIIVSNPDASEFAQQQASRVVRSNGQMELV